MSIVEQSAIRELKEKLYANKNALMEAFQKVDKDNTGMVVRIVAFSPLKDLKWTRN